MNNEEFSDLTKKELIEKINNLSNIRKFGLVWEEKVEEQVEFFDKNIPYLKLNEKKSIFKSPKYSNNILIKGENYAALKILSFTHQEKIDIIFIDPPYNTGNNDFKYNDNWVDIEDSYRHSKWLSFMSSRLKLAKDLLKEDGVLFITIGEDEVAQLVILCKQIFGQNNVINTLVWEKSTSRKNSSKYFSENHDYVVVVAKSISENGWVRKLEKRDEENSNYSNPDNDPRGPWYPGSVKANNPYDADYTIEKPNGVILKKPKNGYWRYSKDSINKFIEDDMVIWGDGDSYPVIKKFKSAAIDGLVPKSILYSDFAGSNPDGARELKDLFDGEKVFNYPKPTQLIIYLMSLHKNKDALVFDFFAGSGSTGHAVIKANELDGGNRKFILCSNDEISKEDEDEFISENKISRKELLNFKDNNPNIWDDFLEKKGIFSSVLYPRIKKLINGFEHSTNNKTLIHNMTLSKTALTDPKTPDSLNKIISDFEKKFNKFEFKFKNNNLNIYGVNSKKEKVMEQKSNLLVYEIDSIKYRKTDIILFNLSKLLLPIIQLKEESFNCIEKTNEYLLSSNVNNEKTLVLNSVDQLPEIIKKVPSLDNIKIYIFSYSNENFEESIADHISGFTSSPFPIPFINSVLKKI